MGGAQKKAIPKKKRQFTDPRILKLYQPIAYDETMTSEQKAERRSKLLSIEADLDKPSPTPGTQDPKPFSLPDLPQEVVDIILRHTLTHRRAIPVNPMFVRECVAKPPALDYRVLFSCRHLYNMGIGHYYRLNTFSISLHEFTTTPRSMSARVWPHFYGLTLASELVRSLKISARCGGTWKHAVRLLQGFVHLDKVVFDVRCDEEIDCSNDDGMYYDAWEVIPASAELVELLRQPNVSIGSGGIWVGSVNNQDARDGLVVVEDALREELRVTRDKIVDDEVSMDA